MNGLTKLGSVRTIASLVSLLVLLVVIFYVLWQKHLIRQRRSPEIHPVDSFYNLTLSKEQLLYFFCLKTKSRIEPAGNLTVPEAPAEAVVVAFDDDYLEKRRLRMYGPSRVLFTIREEEREGTETSETENDQSVKSKTVRFEGDSGSVLVVKCGDTVDCEEPTPFSTPCASPTYYTASPTPTHDKYSRGNDTSFVSVAVCNDY